MPTTISSSATTKRGENSGPRVGVEDVAAWPWAWTRVLLVTATPLVTCVRHRSRATLVGVTPDPTRGPPGRPRPPGAARRRRPAPPASARSAGGSVRRWSVLLCGALFVVSAHNSQGTDLRPGRYTDLASLVGSEARDVRRACSDRVTRPQRRQVDDAHRLRRRPAGAAATSAGSSGSRTRPAWCRAPARASPSRSSDAPEDVIDSSRPCDLNLPRRPPAGHPGRGQRDVEGRRHARSPIQGQRVVTTTGIKCEGNAVQLQGVPYPQPYGSPRSATRPRCWTRSTATPTCRSTASRPPTPTSPSAGTCSSRTRLTAPAYDGLLDLSYAKPLH